MKEFKTDGCIVRVHSPEITKEKADRQTKRIQKAAEKLLKSREGRATGCRQAFKSL